jgi:hypothetical protein
VKFLNEVLLAVNRILKFEGGDIGLPVVEGDLPITRVYDLSRLSDKNSGKGVCDGQYVCQETLTHAAANNQYTARDIYAAAAAQFSEPVQSLDVWWIMHGAHWTANITQLAMGLAFTATEVPGTYSGAGVAYRLLSWWDTALYMADYAGTGDALALADADRPWPVRPFLIPRGARLTYRSVSSGVGVIYPWTLCWVGPRGASPPGYA